MVIRLHSQHGTLWARRKATVMGDDHRRSLEQAMTAGLPIAMGTDAGGYGHGHNAVELALLVENGMTPMQAIIASTSDAARLLEMEADIGTIEAGRYADLLVIDGDPLHDIAILDQKEQIQLIMKGGQIFRNTLTTTTAPILTSA